MEVEDGALCSTLLKMFEPVVAVSVGKRRIIARIKKKKEQKTFPLPSKICFHLVMIQIQRFIFSSLNWNNCITMFHMETFW